MIIYRLIISIMLVSCFMQSYGQNCTEPLIQYLHATEDPCGYHGALDLELIGNTAEDKADDFVNIWKTEFLSRAASNYQFKRIEVKSIGNTTLVKHQVTYDDIPVEDAYLNVSFDAELKLKSYTCQNTSQLPEKFTKTGVLKRLLTSSDEALAEYVPKDNQKSITDSEISFKIVNGQLRPELALKWLSSDNQYRYFSKIDLSENKTLIEPIQAINPDSYKKRKLQRIAAAVVEDCGSVIVASGIGCTFQTVTVDVNNDCSTQNPTYDIISTVDGFEFELDANFNDFAVVTSQTIENDTEDFMSICNNLDYSIANVTYHLTEYYKSSDIIGTSAPDVFFQVGTNEAPYNFSQFGIDFGVMQEDVAEDISYIASAGLHYYLDENYTLSTADALHFGSVDYLLYTDKGWINFFGHSAAPVDQRKLTGIGNYTQYSGHQLGQVWGSALYEIEQELGGTSRQDDVLFLAQGVLAMMTSNLMQYEAAQMLIDLADAEQTRFTTAEVCAIVAIMEGKYPNHNFEGGADFYIRDTPDDVGDEPNEISDKFYISEDLWNCKPGNSGCLTHQDIEYIDATTTNTMRVRLHNIGCTDISSSTGTVEVYASAAAAYHSFDNGDFDPPYGMHVGSQPIAGGALQSDGSYLYNFPWVPFDPGDPVFEDIVGENGRLKLCVRALILDVDDPMRVDDWDNMKWNNNIVQDNMSIIDLGQMAADDPVSLDDGGIVFVVKPPVLPVNPHVPQVPGGGNPIRPTKIAINDVGPGDPVRILTDTDIWISLDPVTYEAWTLGGEKGANFSFDVVHGERGNTWYRFHVLNRGFYLDNILLQEGSAHPIRIGVKEVSKSDPFVLDVDIVDPMEDCIIGGERLTVVNNGELVIRNSSTNPTQNIHISPNPTSHEVSLKMSDEVTALEIVNMQGESLYKYKRDNKQTLTVDVSGFHNGAYFVKASLKDGEQELTKFIKI